MAVSGFTSVAAQRSEPGAVAANALQRHGNPYPRGDLRHAPSFDETEQDVQASDLKKAFLKLVTGLKDMSDAQSDAHRLVLETMTRRIDENLTMRRDKMALASMDGAGANRAREWESMTLLAREVMPKVRTALGR